MQTENTNTTANTITAPAIETETEFTGEATYCPEDNKLRLYVGRVPREEYLKLKAEGWTALHKQRESGGGDFAATWTPARRDTALAYAGFIGDEDKGPAERAADRAERFSGYLGKRLNEANRHADKYEAGPSAHGYQSQARAERAAARHDRIADRAGDAWSKAEYWQTRTAGVISHALYKSAPSVRMGRIKIIEAELRKEKKEIAERAALFNTWKKISGIEDADKQTKAAVMVSGNFYHWSKYIHPRAAEAAAKIQAAGVGNVEYKIERYTKTGDDLYSLLTLEECPITGAEACALFFSDHAEPATENDWTRHFELRLAYERQMIEAAGGMASEQEMIPGGFIGGRQIYKVNKSAVTKRVVSVQLMGTRSGFTRESGYKEHQTRAALVTVNIERLDASAYRPPTDEELTAFLTAQKAAKDAKPKTIKPPLINPTDTDAERLQAIWNERARAEHEAGYVREYGEKAGKEWSAKHFKPSTVCRITQAVYSANSKGNYSRAQTKEICGNGVIKPGQYFYDYDKQAKEAAARGPVVCQLRTTSGESNSLSAPDRVIVLTDKPQKALPAEVWTPHNPALVVPALAETETVNA